MACVVDLCEIGLTLVAYIAQGHVIAVGVFHPIETPTEDAIGIRGISYARTGFLAEVKLLAGFVCGQEIRFAIRGREFFDLGKAAFDLGSVFTATHVDQFNIDPRKPKHIVIP